MEARLASGVGVYLAADGCVAVTERRSSVGEMCRELAFPSDPGERGVNPHCLFLYKPLQSGFAEDHGERRYGARAQVVGGRVETRKKTVFPRKG